ncbi:hypothetical protein BGX30_004490, partial [Mortierella sp. GBA39]
MDLSISKSKKRQNRRRKLRESRRESGEEADEEEAGYSHANEGESDTQDLSFDLPIPTITFKFNKTASRARVDSLYPLYDSSCASSPSKPVNDIQSNVASRPQSNNSTTRNGSGRSQGAGESNSVLSPFLPLSSAHSSETDTSLETVVPPGVDLDRGSDSRIVQSNERQEQTSTLPSMTTFSLMDPSQEWGSLSMSTTPTMAGRMRPTVISFAGSIDTQLDPSVEGELLMTPPPSATLGSMQPHNTGSPRTSLFAGSPSTDDEKADEGQPSKTTEQPTAPTPDISPVLVPSVVPGLPPVSIIEPDHVARLPPLPPFAAPGSSHVVTPPATSNIPPPPPPPPFISASGAAAATATATAPSPVVALSVNNTSGIPPPPPPPPPPGPTGLKKNGPRTPLQISTSIMTTLDSHPPGLGPSLTAPLTPTRSIVARHVLRWDALSHSDISQTVFDTDHHHHHSRHRHHHGHGHRHPSGHIRQASTVPNTPTSLKSPDFLSLEDSKGLDQYVLTDGSAVDDDTPPGAEESSHGYLHGQPEGPLDGPSGPHQESGPGPIAPPLAIEMDFQKFEEMFCIDPVEEQKRLKAKEENAQA